MRGVWTKQYVMSFFLSCVALWVVILALRIYYFRPYNVQRGHTYSVHWPVPWPHLSWWLEVVILRFFLYFVVSLTVLPLLIVAVAVAIIQPITWLARITTLLLLLVLLLLLINVLSPNMVCTWPPPWQPVYSFSVQDDWPCVLHPCTLLRHCWWRSTHTDHNL